MNVNTHEFMMCQVFCFEDTEKWFFLAYLAYDDPLTQGRMLKTDVLLWPPLFHLRVVQKHSTNMQICTFYFKIYLAEQICNT